MQMVMLLWLWIVIDEYKVVALEAHSTHSKCMDYVIMTLSIFPVYPIASQKDCVFHIYLNT